MSNRPIVPNRPGIVPGTSSTQSSHRPTPFRGGRQWGRLPAGESEFNRPEQPGRNISALESANVRPSPSVELPEKLGVRAGTGSPRGDRKPSEPFGSSSRASCDDGVSDRATSLRRRAEEALRSIALSELSARNRKTPLSSFERRKLRALEVSLIRLLLTGPKPVGRRIAGEVILRDASAPLCARFETASPRCTGEASKVAHKSIMEQTSDNTAEVSRCH